MRIILSILILSVCFPITFGKTFGVSGDGVYESTNQLEQVSEQTELYSGRLDLAVSWCTGSNDEHNCCQIASLWIERGNSGWTMQDWGYEGDGYGLGDGSCADGGHIPIDFGDNSWVTWSVDLHCCLKTPENTITVMPSSWTEFNDGLTTNAWDAAFCDVGLGSLRFRGYDGGFVEVAAPSAFAGCDCNTINSDFCSGTTVTSWENFGLSPNLAGETSACMTSAVLDCNGDCGGDTEIDECGICGGVGIIEPFCDCQGNIKDCVGECGGNSLNCVGCIYESACNYDSVATIDNGSCVFASPGYDCEGNELSILDDISPLKYEITDVFPNPFNPITTISFSIPQSGMVSLKVSDITGKVITTLKDEYTSVGYYNINWNASSYPSGVYLIRMDSGDFTQTQKVVLVK